MTFRVNTMQPDTTVYQYLILFSLTQTSGLTSHNQRYGRPRNVTRKQTLVIDTTKTFLSVVVWVWLCVCVRENCGMCLFTFSLWSLSLSVSCAAVGCCRYPILLVPVLCVDGWNPSIMSSHIACRIKILIILFMIFGLKSVWIYHDFHAHLIDILEVW